MACLLGSVKYSVDHGLGLREKVGVSAKNPTRT